MARNNAPKIELTAYDDLFETDQSREEAKLSKIRDIPISEMHNELRDTPKTGDDFNPALWGGLAAACVLGAGVLGVTAFKGRKKKED